MASRTQVASLSIMDNTIRMLEGLFSLNDLHKASGGHEKHKPVFFLRNQQTKDLIAEIDAENTNGANLHLSVKTVKGAFGGTYVCRELVYAYAMWISARFHLLVIRAFDAQRQTAIPRATITPEQKAALMAIVDRRVEGHDSLRAGMWKRHNRHFNINSYHELLAVHFDDAVQYLETMELKMPRGRNEPVALPISGRQRLLLVIEDGIITGSKPVPENACIINPDDPASINTLLSEYVRLDNLPSAISTCVNRIASSIRPAIASK